MGATFRELPTSFGEALQLAVQLLERNHALVARGGVLAEAEMIVCAAYRAATSKQIRRTDLYLRIQDRYPDGAGDKLIEFAVARSEGKLLQHLFGYQYFGDHEYRVNSAVLVPRPETELLLLEAMDQLGRETAPPELGIEIGLGSGILSIELLARWGSLRMIATELSDGALQVARENSVGILGEGAARRLTALRVERAEVCAPVARHFATEGFGKADFLISNPPYLLNGSEADDEVVAHEPAEALFAPPSDPLFFYREIAENAQGLLKPGAPVFVEIAHERVAETEALFKKCGWNSMVRNDLANRPRVLVARKGSQAHG